jgi:ADP-ribose pyrophosphatase YjhB (NUDIX family)
MSNRTNRECIKVETGEKMDCGKQVNESDFDWVGSIPDTPIEWKQPKITLDNVERDADDWPVEYGNGEGEIWVDFEEYTNDEKIEIFHSIEKHLGSELYIEQGGVNDDRDVKIITCTSNIMKGLLLHCGHEENHYFSQKNHVCCMPETYDEFMEYERTNAENPNIHQRPKVDGGIFLEKKNLTEDFYYKGVNPTVDLVVIRGDEVLLIKRGDDVDTEPGKWALPGGFHDTNAKKGEEWREDKESALDAAKREVKEETGLDVDSIKGLIFQLVGVYEGGNRDPRDREDSWTRSTVYMVRIPEVEGDDVEGMDDAQSAEWIPIKTATTTDLAFDHEIIVRQAVSMNESEAKDILKTLLKEENEFDWAEDIEDELDQDLYMEVAEAIDDEVSVGPYYERFTQTQTFRDLDTVLQKYNIDIGDMSGFFTFGEVKDASGNHITNNQLRSLKDDLIRVGVINLDDENLHESNGFEWTEEIKPMRYYHVYVCQNMDDDECWSGYHNWLVIPEDELVDILDMELEPPEGDRDRWVTDEDMVRFGDYIRRKNIIKRLTEHEVIYDVVEISQSLYNEKTGPSDSRFRNLDESNDFEWTEDISTVQIGDVFHTRGYTPKTRGDSTFEIFDISPNGEWVRWTHHDMRGSFRDGVQHQGKIPIDKINLETRARGWDERGHGGANSTRIEQVMKNINSGFWKKLDIPGYMDEHPEEYEKLIRLGSINESDDFGWTDSIKAHVDKPVDMIHVGAIYRINPDRIDTGLDMVLKVYEVNNNDVHYEIIVSNSEDERIGEKGYVSRNEALRLLNKKKTWDHHDDGTVTERELEPYWLYQPYESINESDFDWAEEVPTADEYRFFEVYVCYQNYYDEEEQEDECIEGGSYFLKIPSDVVSEIWNYEAKDGYYAGPGDEGLDVIDWAVQHSLMEPDDYDYAEYVTEHTKKEFCLAWGNYHDKEICEEFEKAHWLTNEINESEFDWVEDHEPFKAGSGKYMIDFTTEDEDTSGYLGFGERKRRGDMKNILTKLGYSTNGMSLTHHYYYLDDFKRKGNEMWSVQVDDYEEGD